MKKFLIMGGGSMGKRRIRCLVANEIETSQIRLVDTRQDRREEVRNRYQVESLANLEDGLAWDPDAVIVCVPGSLHMDVCLPAARAGKHVFCEEPLSTDLEGTDELAELAEQKGIVVAPGCQLPLHPLIRQVKQWISDPAFGEPLIYHEVIGQYLPDWHPYEDYRGFYGVSQKMGGGNLDVIAQELAGLWWITGDGLENVFCQGGLLSTLEIEGYDCHQIVGRTRGGMALTLQFDLIRRESTNFMQIVSQQGTIELRGNQVRRFLAGAEGWETVDLPEGFQYEQCYVDEIKFFLECLEGRSEWFYPLPVAVDVVRSVLAVSKSASLEQVVHIPEARWASAALQI